MYGAVTESEVGPARVVGLEAPRQCQVPPVAARVRAAVKGRVVGHVIDRDDGIAHGFPRTVSTPRRAIVRGAPGLHVDVLCGQRLTEKDRVRGAVRYVG